MSVKRFIYVPIIDGYYMHDIPGVDQSTYDPVYSALEDYCEYNTQYYNIEDIQDYSLEYAVLDECMAYHMTISFK